jgi:transposase
MHTPSTALAAGSTDIGTVLYIALELSRSTWVVAVQSRGRARPSVHKLAAGDVNALLKLAETRGLGVRRARLLAAMRLVTTAFG